MSNPRDALISLVRLTKTGGTVLRDNLEAFIFQGNVRGLYTDARTIEFIEAQANVPLGHLIVNIVKAFVQTSDANDWRRTLKIIIQCAKVFRPSSEHLTPFHAFALQFAFDNNFCAAVKDSLILGDTLVLIDPPSTGITVDSYMNYFYLAGKILTMYEDYEGAAKCFKACSDVPGFEDFSSGKSAFYAHSLVAPFTGNAKLLHLGKGYRPHKNFAAFSKAALDGKDAEAQALLSTSADDLHKRHLAETASLMYETRHAPQILRFTKVYNTLSFSDMAEALQVKEEQAVIRTLLTLVAQKKAYVSIDFKERVVYFHDPPAKSQVRLEEAVSNAMTLSDRLSALEGTMRCSAQYFYNSGQVFEEIQATKANEKGGGAAGEMMMDDDF